MADRLWEAAWRGAWIPTVPFNKDMPQWPLSFAIRNAPADQEYWSYTHYRGPGNQTVEITYSNSLALSETIAQTFLKEPVLGFGMEWPIDVKEPARLQERGALIQLACESRIALFHIALHDGQTSEDLIAPSLRRIIESPAILKTGVAIMDRDFKKLGKFFKLVPKGAFELCFLHNLVQFGYKGPRHVTTKLWKLRELAEVHLGSGLWKDDVRTSDWRKPLNEEQITYAANDAYACFMLFHCMNAKRLWMTPTLTFPMLAESYLPWVLLDDLYPVKLEPTGDLSRDAFIINDCIFGSTKASRMQTLWSLRSRVNMAARLQDASSHVEVPDAPLRSLAEGTHPISKSRLLRTFRISEEKARSLGGTWPEVMEGFDAMREYGRPKKSDSNASVNQLSPEDGQDSKRRRLEISSRADKSTQCGPPPSAGLSFPTLAARINVEEKRGERDNGGNQGERDALPAKRKRALSW
ncbi:ribonuclease H-like domain-containing protein [Hypoxylon sp. FL1150]|nr:ribonuclease H-like domain-containing protein [Hypoxylon sp. FL1150]